MSYPICAMHIAERLASDRTYTFLSEHQDVLSDVIGRRQELSLPPYKPEDFLNLLHALVENGNSIRTHFAVYKKLPPGDSINNENNLLVTDGRDRENLLTIIYQSVVHQDYSDTKSYEYYFIHETKGFIKLNDTIAKTWIDQWKDNYRLEFAKRVHKSYQTKSMLFPMQLITHAAPDIGLLEMLELWKNHFISLKIFFATYKNETVAGENVNRQLSFIIYCENDYETPDLLNKEFVEAIVKLNRAAMLGGDNNDTGLPCPPAKNCP